STRRRWNTTAPPAAWETAAATAKALGAVSISLGHSPRTWRLLSPTTMRPPATTMYSRSDAHGAALVRARSVSDGFARPVAHAPGSEKRNKMMIAIRPTRLKLPQFRDRLSLGNKGLHVSPYCLGIVRSPETVEAAFDAGINFFFVTADLHWPLYEATRQGLQALLARGRSVRNQIVVASVCYPTQPEVCSAPFRELLEAIPGLDRLDVLVAGGAYAQEFAERLPVFLDHRDRGFLGARAIGATFHERTAALTAIQQGCLDIALIRYNPDHAGARQDVFPHLPRQRSTLLFNFKSTFRFVPPEQLEAMGLPTADYWHPEITDYYRFALSR